MSQVEAIKKILKRTPSRKNWDQLWEAFLGCDDADTAEAMEAVKKKLSKKWEPDHKCVEGLDWNGPLHPMLAVVNTVQLSVEGMESIPQELGAFLAKTSVVKLELRDCEKLTDISALGQIKKLRALHIVWCRRLEDLTGLESLKSLGTLELSGSFDLADFSPLFGLKKLTTLDLTESKGFSDLQSIGQVTSLKKLILVNCRHLQSLAGLEGLQALTEADFSDCDAIRECREFASLPKLKRLHFTNNHWFKVPPPKYIFTLRKEVEAYQQQIRDFYESKS